MSLYSTVASGVESAAKANGYSIDLGAKSAREASATGRGGSASRHGAYADAPGQGYGEDGEEDGGTREQAGGGGSAGWGRGWGDEDDDDGGRGSGGNDAAPAPSARAAAAAPASSQRRNDGFVGFEDGADDGEDDRLTAAASPSLVLGFCSRPCVVAVACAT